MPHYLNPRRSDLQNTSLQSLHDAKEHHSLKHRHRAGSPFDKLPAELQIEIFSYCLPDLPHFDINEGPLLLTRVCQSWKSLILSTARLWSAFEIEITGSGINSTVSHDRYVMDTMDRWLKRSKGYPLTVRVAHIPIGRVSNHRSSELVAALLPHARRWKNVQLILPASDVKTLQQSLPVDLPQLQSLAIKLNGLWSSDTALDISALNIPWHRLSVIDLQLEHNNLLTLDRCLEILSQTENLRCFTASVECILSDAHTIKHSLPLPFLESLDLILHDGTIDAMPSVRTRESYLTQFLSSLSLSKLSDLRLGWSVKQASAWSPTHSKFIGFLRSVASTLESLSIRYIPLSEQELMECMTELPGLRQLDLRFSFSVLDIDPVTDAFFRECTPRLPRSPSTDGRISPPHPYLHTRTHTQPMLPSLQSLTLHCCGKWYSNASLEEFFDSRLWTSDGYAYSPLPTNTLRSFHLLSLNTVIPEMRELLRSYRDDGADVSMDTLVIR